MINCVISASTGGINLAWSDRKGSNIEICTEDLQKGTCRPLISLLSSVSKILEKLIYDFIFAYVQSFYPLSPNECELLPGIQLC